jgi:hypothetical protein
MIPRHVSDQNDIPTYVINVRVATTHRIPAYGGLQLARSALMQMKDKLLAGGVPMQLDHDPPRPVTAEWLSLDLVELEDGESALDGEVRVDGPTWDAFQEGLAAEDAPGGMSFSFTQALGTVEPIEPLLDGEFSLAADASHFDSAGIKAATQALGAFAPARGEELFQLSAAHPCRVVIEYVGSAGGLSVAQAAVSAGFGLIASAITASVKELLARRRTRNPEAADVSRFEIRVNLGVDGKRSFFIDTNDPDDAARAMEIAATLIGVTEPTGRYLWSHGTWTRSDEDSQRG